MPRPLISVLLLPLLAGCDRWIFTFETRIDPAARLSRETRIEHHGDGASTIAEKFRLPEGTRIEDQGSTAVVHASANTPREAASDFVLAANTGRPEPRNTIGWAREDCVFFDHYVYCEAFKDSVDEVDRDAATARLFAYSREIALQAAAMDVDGRYDLARLTAWLDGPMRHLTFDIVRIVCTEKQEKRLKRRLAARLGAEGIAVGEDLGALDEALHLFLEAKLRELLTPRNGAPPYDPAPLFARDAEGKERIEVLFKDAAAAVHGSNENAQKAGDALVHEVIGDLGDAPIEFRARVTMPGRILRTNGVIEEPERDARVVWTFAARDVRSTGHTLEMETIVMRPEALARVPRGKAALDAADVLAVIAAVDGLDGDARARLTIAFLELDPATPDAAKERLPEELRAAFEKLLNAAERAR